MSNTKVAIVTGAGGGIGAAICQVLASRGNEIIAVDRNESAMDKVVSGLKEKGHSARAVALDITDGKSLDSLIASVPAVSVLVNNAGIFDVKNFVDLTADDFRRTYEVNVVAMAELTRRALSKMQKGDAIVNIASVAMYGALNFAHYSASKAAVGALTKSLALELAPRGIRANAVAPGAIATPMLLDRKDSDSSNVLKRIPLGAYGDPGDIANAVGFLSSQDAKYITGVVLAVDGGRTLSGPSAG